MDIEAIKRIIGQNVAKYREEAGLTQAELAERIGISTAFISRVERGQKMMKVYTLCAVAQALYVSCDALVNPPSPRTYLENINVLLRDQSAEYLSGIEKLIRTCVEEFDAREKKGKHRE
ncbi:XRE family transcriptional regulator [Pseudoflavonifractor sp. 524-17]|uniref:helix-turn-helix domain-containing protein n=1 Tax=Pseudoflavonifractor sp. 524-17 TaxID=2304577 RepID=UPI001379DCE1|nr:XRE family transcriptional regulator [Pseudoflavonifractor sp. 524-17]